MKHSYIIHSAKGTEWVDHKYTKKTADGKYYYDEESYQNAKKDEQDLVNEEDKLWKASQKAGNGSITAQQHRIAQSKLQTAVRTSEQIEKYLDKQKSGENNNNTESSSSSSSSSSSKKSGSKSKKDSNDPNSKFGKWGKGSTKSSSSSSKSSESKSASQSSGSSKETSTKSTEKKEESTVNKQVSVKASIKKAISDASIKMGDNDSFVATQLSDGGYRIQVTYADGSFQTVTVDKTGKVKDAGSKLKMAKGLQHSDIMKWNPDEGFHLEHSCINSNYGIRRKR